MSNHSSLKENDTELFNIHSFNISLKYREDYLHSFIDITDEGGVDYR